MRCFFSFALTMLLLSSQVLEAQNTLPKLVKAALEYHPSVKSSEQRIAVAEEQVKSSWWQYAPTPSFSYQKTDTVSVFERNKEELKLSLKQPLWTFGKLTSGLNSSKAALEATLGSLEEVRQTLTLEIITLTGNIYRNEKLLSIHQEYLSTHDVLLWVS